MDAMFVFTDCAALLHLCTNRQVDLHAGAVVGRDYQRTLRRLRVFLRYCGDAILTLCNLMDAALPLQALHGLAHLAPRKLLDHLFQLQVFLPDNLFEFDCLHARVLELREGTPGLDRLMLPPITYQQHAVIGLQAIHKLVHLLGGCKRGFIEHIQAALAGIRLFSTRKMLLQRGCFHACVGQLLRRAGRGREAFDGVPLRLRAFTDDGQRRCLPRASDTIQPHYLFAGEKHLVNGLAL
jgi:hypothetical protein